MNCQAKLEEIFRSVFFELEGKDATFVHNANKVNLSTWDSAQHLLLLTCIEEDFGIKIPDEDAISIDSFSYARAYIDNAM